METELRTLRTQKRVRLSEVADAAGMSIAAVSAIETGKQTCRADAADKIAKRLGVSRRRLFAEHAFKAKEVTE